jgi:hypothetical protein
LLHQTEKCEHFSDKSDAQTKGWSAAPLPAERRALPVPPALHRGKRVAVDDELRHPHQHGKEVVEQRRRVGGKEFRPDLHRRTQAEIGRHVETGRGDEAIKPALADLHHIARIAKADADVGVELLADDRKLRIRVDAFLECSHPDLSREAAHTFPPALFVLLYLQ